MHVFRIIFVSPTGVPSALHVVAFNASEAIAAAVQHKSAAHSDVVGCERCVAVDALAASVRAELRRAHAVVVAEVS